MTGRRIFVRTIAAAALLAVLLIAGASGARAQLAWPCATLTVVNTTNCSTTLKIQTNIGILAFPVAGGATSAGNPIPAGTIFAGIRSQANIFYALVAQPAPSTAWCVFGVYLPNTTCCFDVCIDPATCTATLSASAVSPCNP